MTCANCQRESPADAVFCVGCGNRLESSCPSCGRAREPGSAYCAGCGQRLDAASAMPSSRAPWAGASGHPTAFASERYRVIRFLGEGGGKRVYLARDSRLERDVAISLIKAEVLDEDTRLRVQVEAQALGRLGDHPNVVTVFDVAEESGQLYIISEYLPGGDLETRIGSCEKRQLPIEDALRIASEIASGLAHAHAHRLVHRDIKPANVWFTRDGTAKLGDFGLAASLGRSRMRHDGMMVGTMAYMAPEQALGKALDARSDLYSLGAMLYEMLAGRPPFLGDDAVSIISQHVNTPPVAPSWHNPNVPKPLEAIVLRLLAKDLEQRPESAVQVREDLDAIATKGAEVLAKDDEPRVASLDRLAGGIFVGRVRELDLLRKSFDAVMDGKGRIVTLAGEPGIGKTRTAEELSTYAHMRGAQVLWGRCYEGGGAPAYWPWIQIIRAYVHAQEPASLRSEMGAGAADIAEVVSQVRDCLPDLPSPPELEPEQARFRLFDSITTFFNNASRSTPLLLILDDLHWADASSLLLLEFMMREIGQSRLLIVGTYRDLEAERQPALQGVLVELSRQQHGEQVVLQGVSNADVSRFIELTAGVPLESLAATVYRETEGNPLFMHEVVRLLEADGRLDASQTGSFRDLEIPRGVRQVLRHRLDFLSDECKQILTVASVIGRDFDLKVLAECADLGAEDVLARLDEASAARVVEVDHAAARFSHSLIRELIHDELPVSERVQLHRRVGEAYEKIYGANSRRHLGDLAHHFCEGQPGGDVDKAIDYAVRAAKHARSSRAFQEAVLHMERALQVLELETVPDEPRRCDLLLALAKAELTLQGMALEEVKETFRRAVNLARELGLSGHFAEAAIGYATSPVPGVVDQEAIGQLEEALRLIDASDSPLRVRLLSSLARQLASRPSQKSLSVAKDAVESARRCGEKEPLLHALESWLQATWAPANAERLAVADEMLEIVAVKSDARLSRIAMLLELGDVPAVDSELATYTEEAAALRTPSALQYAKLLQAARSLLRGDFDDAEQATQDVIAIRARASLSASRPGDPLADYFVATLFNLRRAQGRLPELEPAIEGFTKLYGNPLSRAALAFLYSELGRTADARRELQRLLPEQLREIPRDRNWPMTIALLSEVAAHVDDTDRAGVLYELLQPLSSSVIVAGYGTGCAGSAARHLGLLAGTLGQWDEAGRHFEDAIETNARMGARPFLADTEHAYAQMLLRRGEPEDVDRALELANQALDTARQLGMKGLVDRAATTKLEAQGVDASDTYGSIHAVASAVRRERPDLTPAAAPDGTVTLMFSDMEDYTGMVERLGDLAAHQLVEAHNAIVREQVVAHGGHEVELRGDGFLLAFASARQGVLCGIALQRAIAEHSQEHPEQAVRLRIGLHTGEAIRDEEAFFGKSVIQAFRVSDLAGGGEILVSSLTRELIETAGDVEFDEGRDVKLKGLSGTHRVYAVQWD